MLIINIGGGTLAVNMLTSSMVWGLILQSSKGSFNNSSLYLPGADVMLSISKEYFVRRIVRVKYILANVKPVFQSIMDGELFQPGCQGYASVAAPEVAGGGLQECHDPGATAEGSELQAEEGSPPYRRPGT